MHGCLSIAKSVPCHLHNVFWTLLPHQPEGLWNVEKFCSDITYLLVSTEVGTVKDRIYGLSMIWLNPYQASVPNVEEAVKQLTALVPTGADWPYAMVWLNGDTHHAPLPREGHLSTLVEGTNSAACGRVSQLEVHQLLSSHSQVIYPARLNGCEVPVITSLPESLAKGTNLLGGKPIYLKVDILQPNMEEPEFKVLPLGGHSSFILMPSPIRAPLPKAEEEVLSQAILDTSGHASRNSTPKRLYPVVVLTPPPPQTGRFSQARGHIILGEYPGWCWDGDASLEEIPTAISPTAKTPGPSGGTPPTDTGHLQKRPTKL